ncbi:MAG TPA: transglycosylase SLT domain-containing protein [Ramlibacter sp.]|nr:transglycosylase SLT domain-containing protein [Ramlibacter sp.]
MLRAVWPAYSAIAGFITVGSFCFATLALRQAPTTPLRSNAPLSFRVQPSHVDSAVRGQPEALPDAFGHLRKQLHWVPTKVGGEMLMSPDYESRMLLAKSAAERAGLSDVGLSFKDVYAIINAETSWAPRAGASRDGTPNIGIAQFEPATAKALGLRNPDDPVEAVFAAAAHMKEAALWSRDRLRPLRLSKAEYAEKLREGVSIYYNLSTRGRNQWNGMNTAKLPVETQRHIANARTGAMEAQWLEAQLSSRRRAGSSAVADARSY